MSQSEDTRIPEHRKIKFWLGDRAEGEWVSESVALKGAEVSHIHGGYHPRFKGDKKVRRAFFFRGARVWRD